MPGTNEERREKGVARSAFAVVGGDSCLEGKTGKFTNSEQWEEQAVAELKKGRRRQGERGRDEDRAPGGRNASSGGHMRLTRHKTRCEEAVFCVSLQFVRGAQEAGSSDALLFIIRKTAGGRVKELSAT